MDFKNSETAKNLMRAFAGESQARNRYAFAAQTAKREGLPVVQSLFLFTAAQEKEHGEMFYGSLKELAGQAIHVDGGYPVDQYDRTLDLLKAARHNEYEEYDPVYSTFERIAKEEGFLKVAGLFHMVADIEKTHGDRFQLFADYLEKGHLFVSDVETGWMCLNCGFVHKGKAAPEACPVCKHGQGYFIRLELAPFTK